MYSIRRVNKRPIGLAVAGPLLVLFTPLILERVNQFHNHVPYILDRYTAITDGHIGPGPAMDFTRLFPT